MPMGNREELLVDDREQFVDRLRHVTAWDDLSCSRVRPYGPEVAGQHGEAPSGPQLEEAHMLSAGRVTAMAAAGSLAVCAPLTRSSMLPRAEAPSMVEIVNRTTLAYRIRLAADKTSQPLGIVPAQEAREFVIPAWIVRTYDEVYLVATARDGSGDETISLEFHATAGSNAKWTLDATRLRTVLVR